MAIRRIKLNEQEIEKLTEAAIEVLYDNPSIHPGGLFYKAQEEALAPERRRDISRLKKEQYEWLYDKVVSLNQSDSSPEEPSPGTNSEPTVEKPESTEEELIQEFVRHMAPGSGESVENRFQLIEDRLQGIEHLLGSLTGAMRQVLNQKKVTGTS